MNPERIAQLVDRGLAVVAQIDTLKAELKQIEAQLKKAGLAGRHTELADAERDGRKFEARGSTTVVPVIFTADLLVKSFAQYSTTHALIQAKAGDRLDHFYTLTPTYETAFQDGKQFRAEADAMLGEDAPAFITACLQRGKGGIPKSQVKFEWKTALAGAGAAAQDEEVEV